MNWERAVDHVVVMIINCSAIAAMVFLIYTGNGWWSLLFLLCFYKSSPHAAVSTSTKEKG